MTVISLCMIVRDEAENLGRCLASARAAVDEIVVVDTGSRDATVEIARSHGARVESFAWCDDFSAARNVSLARASGDWALVLDADEEVAGAVDARDTRSARELLLAFTRAHPRSAGRFTSENLGAEGGVTRLAVTRFFPLDGHFRFEGVVHERVLCDGVDPARGNTGLLVRHFGYAPEAVRRGDKLARNTRLLRAELARAPADSYVAFQLGRTLALAGEHASALEVLEQALARCPDDASWAAQLLETAGYSLRALDRSAQALALLSEVEARFASRADTCFLIALLAMDVGQLERAEAGFRRCLDLPMTPTAVAEESLSARTVAPAFNLGVMREVLGRKEEAAEWYRRALAFEPTHAPSLAGLRRLGVERA